METIIRLWTDHRRRVLAWFQDDVFRRLFVNAGKLLSANAVGAVLGLVATVVTARTLGPQNYGILALVLVYELTVGKLVTFNAWQAIIKFGSEALHAHDRAGLRQLIKFGFALDVVSALAGTALAMILAGPVIRLLGWDASVRPLLVLYSVLILFGLSGTPIGVLRLFDRFDLLSYTAVLSAAVRLVGVAWCFLTSQRLFGFVLVYLITGIVGQLYQIVASLWVLRKEGIGWFVAQPLRGFLARFPRILGFVVTTNLNTTLKTAFHEGGSLVIAGLTSPAALGYYKIAQQFTKPLLFLSEPLNQSIYPELARLWAADRTRQFTALLKRSVAVVATVALCGWVAFLLLGGTMLRLVLGSGYDTGYAYSLVSVFLLVVVVSASGSLLPASMYAMGLHRRVMAVYCSGMVIYFAVLLPFIKYWSVAGAVYAYLTYSMWWLLSMVYSVCRSLQRNACCTTEK